jgi:tripartite-type tricarboxylate transporter receptor subunit TctC
MSTGFRRALAGMLACAGTLCGAADWQPAKPVRIVVPFAPGGQPDVVARTLAEPLAKALGQPVVIENKPGAGGNIAADLVAKSAPDGHTLLMGTNGPLALSVVIYKSVPFDPLRDFAPVTLVGTAPNLIAVQPSLGVASVQELVAKARAEPGKLNYASVGKGSISQLSMEMLNAMAGIRIEHVPYNGGAPATMALLSGEVQVLSLNPTALLPQVKAGKARILAQTGATRSAHLPDVPTVAESGFPGFEAGVWMAVVAPARTPPEAITRLNAELVRIIRSPELKASLWDRQGIDAVGSPPGEVTRTMRAEIDKWAGVARRANLAVD